VKRMLRFGQHASEIDVGGVAAVVAVDVLQARRQLCERVRLEASMLLETFLHAGLQLVEAPSAPGHNDDRHIQMAATRQRLQSRENLLECQVARRSKKYQCVRMRCG